MTRIATWVPCHSTQQTKHASLARPVRSRAWGRPPDRWGRPFLVDGGVGAYSSKCPILPRVHMVIRPKPFDETVRPSHYDMRIAVLAIIIKGNQNMTLKTIAKLECALDMDITYGFRNPKPFPTSENNVVRFPARVKGALES